MEIINKIQKLALIPLYFLGSQYLGGCGLIADRIREVGKVPALNKVSTYETEQANMVAKAHLSAPVPDRYVGSRGVNSLWKPGSRTFFRDQRARAVGDILKVKVVIQDKAKLDNKTEKTRSGSSNFGIPNLLGAETKIGGVLAPGTNPKKLLGINSADNSSGHGKVDRKEDMTTTIAATVIKILPSGNLMISGSQEIRVNFELREVTIEGIVRPEDISSDNAITLEQIAEARMSYGGRGHISDYQQDKYGKQVLDIISPF